MHEILMRIIRFCDEDHQLRYGHNHRIEVATVRKSSLFDILQDTEGEVGVKKTLALFQPTDIRPKSFYL